MADIKMEDFPLANTIGNLDTIPFNSSGGTRGIRFRDLTSAVLNDAVANSTYKNLFTDSLWIKKPIEDTNSMYPESILVDGFVNISKICTDLSKEYTRFDDIQNDIELVNTRVSDIIFQGGVGIEDVPPTKTQYVRWRDPEDKDPEGTIYPGVWEPVGNRFIDFIPSTGLRVEYSETDIQNVISFSSDRTINIGSSSINSLNFYGDVKEIRLSSGFALKGKTGSNRIVELVKSDSEGNVILGNDDPTVSTTEIRGGGDLIHNDGTDENTILTSKNWSSFVTSVTERDIIVVGVTLGNIKPGDVIPAGTSFQDLMERAFIVA